MDINFFRFPHTPHIAWLGDGLPRHDKILSASEVDELLSDRVIVEEKLDGANLGFSVGPEGNLMVQNRGQFILEPYQGQFQYLPQWIALHGADLTEILGSELIAFGEWCAARHSLDYISLPDWWLLFDIYDRRSGKFWSTRRRNEFAAEMGFATVPCISNGPQMLSGLLDGVENWKSKFRAGSLEGVIVRREDEHWLLCRGKLVRSDFTQAIDVHWRRRKIEWNKAALNSYQYHNDSDSI